MRKDSANIISFKCLHIHQNYTSHTGLEVPTKCFASSSASMHSNFFIWGFTHTYRTVEREKKTKKKGSGIWKPEKLHEHHLCKYLDYALRCIIFSTQSLQHTPIIICWVLPFWLHIYMTNHGQNVIGQFLVDNFQICSCIIVSYFFAE